MRRVGDASSDWSSIDIPPMTVGPLTEDEDGILLWVHTGAATVDAEGTAHRLMSGDAMWIPAGVEHRTRTDAGAVVFPVRLPAGDRSGSLGEVRGLRVPDGWAEWLIHQWDDNSSTRDSLPSAAALVELVARPPGAESRPPGDRPSLQLPRSREAVGVARDILRTPGSSRTIDAFAARERISAKTLQRQFVGETGVTFSIWRTRARIAIAAGRLDEGRPIGETRRAVGFATAAGFTRAFRVHTGVTPSEYRRRDGRSRDAVDPVPPDGGRATRLLEAITRAAPSIPARTFWQKVNDHHELMWVHRGSATLRIGGRQWALREGQAIWVPAGLTHTVVMPAESLMLTVGVAHGRFRTGVDDLIVFDFPRAAEPLLLHTMISEFTLFRPGTAPGALTRALFHEQFLASPPHGDQSTGALTAMVTALRREPGDSRSLAEWAAHLRTTPGHLGREILTQSGESFPRWRSRIRMDVARDLLRAGESPTQVFRRLGYASPTAFSRAFASAHGMTPREYQRRELP